MIRKKRRVEVWVDGCGYRKCWVGPCTNVATGSRLLCWKHFPNKELVCRARQSLPLKNQKVAEEVACKRDGCNNKPIKGRRGLCFRCWLNPEIREVFGSRQFGCGNLAIVTTPPLPPEPTDVMPGTPDKVLLMEARAVAGYQIFHPKDRQFMPNGPPIRRDWIEVYKDHFSDGRFHNGIVNEARNMNER